jgi:hypothetical protein
LAPRQQALIRHWTHTTLTNHEWENNTYLEDLPSSYTGPRVIDSEFPSDTHHIIHTVEYPQQFHFPETNQSIEHSFHFPPDLLDEIPAGYYTPNQGPGINEPTHLNTSISLEITTSPITPTRQPEYLALFVRGPTFLSNPYQAELLAVSAASTLSTPQRKVHIITDCQSITSQLERLRTPNEYIPRTDLTPHLTSIVHSNTTLTWVRAHSEKFKESPSIYQYGNQIADAIASNSNLPNWAHPPRNQYTITLDSFIPTNTQSVTFTSSDSMSTTLPSSRAIQQYIAKISLHKYITNRHTSFYQHHLTWLQYTWTASGQAFKKMLKNLPADTNISRKTMVLYYHKTLYDKFRNQAWKHKIDNPRLHNTEDEDAIPPPLCPLCHQENDSMTHLLVRCTHIDITHIRNNCIHNITQDLTIKDRTSNYQHIIQALYQDSRAWACLIPVNQHFPTFVQIASKALTHTIPAVHAIMKIYNSITHVSIPPPNTPPLLNLLTRRGRTIRTRTAPVVLRTLRPRKPPPPPSMDIRAFFPSTKPQHPSSPTDQTWTSPTKTIKRSFCTPSPQKPRYAPRRIIITPETPDPLYAQFNNLHVEEHNIADLTINNTPTVPTMPIQHNEVVQVHIPPQLHIEHVALILGYKLAEVAGDGNCMLHSITKSLSHQYPTHKKNLDPKKLRHAIHAHICIHQQAK